jgi:hypothetical protein
VTERDDLPYGKDQSDIAVGAALARAQLAQARAQTCDCGMRRELCKTHRVEPEEVTP